MSCFLSLCTCSKFELSWKYSVIYCSSLYLKLPSKTLNLGTSNVSLWNKLCLYLDWLSLPLPRLVLKKHHEREGLSNQGSPRDYASTLVQLGSHGLQTFLFFLLVFRFFLLCSLVLIQKLMISLNSSRIFYLCSLLILPGGVSSSALALSC